MDDDIFKIKITFDDLPNDVKNFTYAFFIISLILMIVCIITLVLNLIEKFTRQSVRLFEN